MRKVSELVFLMLLVATAASAQNKVITVTITGPNSATAQGTDASGITDVGGSNVELTIACGGGVDCSTVNAVFRSQAVVLTNVDAQTKRGTIPSAQILKQASGVIIRSGNKRITSVRLQNTAAPNGNAAGGNRAGQSNVCTLVIPETYLQDEDVAHFVVTPGGSILQYPDQPVDEDDIVNVHVVGDRAIVENIEAARTSATRQTGTLSIAGEGQEIDFQAAEDRVLDCVERTFTLGDFAAGEATVEMYTIVEGTKTTLGSFRFNVNKLYHGILSFGPARTRTVDTDFQLVKQGDKNVIVPTAEGDDIVQAIYYTHYAWGRRDLEKKTSHWYHHINPTVGFSVADTTDHALAGVSIDLGFFLINGGVHYGRVTTLSPTSGLEPGSPFTGTKEEIPRTDRWKSSGFIGVSVDLRAASALLKALGGD